MGATRVSGWRASLGAAAIISCADSAAPPRPQWILVLDTNAPLVGELAREPALSPDAAIDTLRIDVFEGGRLLESRALVVPSPESWPVSLGVVPARDPVTVRARAFRGLFSSAGVTAGGESLPEPLPETAIDRLVTLDSPAGVSFVRIVLDAACFGTPASFVGDGSSCIASASARSPATEGVVASKERPVARYAGRSTLSGERACEGEAPSGAACVPGGFSVLGEPSLVGFSDEQELVPLKPVVISPFFFDETEFTVGRFRALVRDKKIRGVMPTTPASDDPLRVNCTWHGPTETSADDLPLNCVPIATAEEACAAVGGSLPSEAEWEHAARGRGQRRAYPWGDGEPDCCRASVSREAPVETAHRCNGAGVEPAGSHRGEGACAGRADISRDGVLDLGGSLHELTRDKHRSYAHRCWGTFGVLVDPVCVDDTTGTRGTRGGAWHAGTQRSLAALRRPLYGVAGDSLTGFRCRYPRTQ